MRERVAVIVLNWNGWADTTACLESIYASEFDDFGVVVCDNRSSDDSWVRLQEWARSTRLRGRPLRTLEVDRTSPLPNTTEIVSADLILLQTGANLGFAGGNNVGLRLVVEAGVCEYVWLLNNDTKVAPTTMRALVDRMRADPRLGAVGGTMLGFDDGEEQEAGGLSSSWNGMSRRLDSRGMDESATTSHGPLEYISGGCLLARAEVVRCIGLLDERFFMYCEDADWGIRMRQAGYGLALERTAVLWHKAGASTGHRSPLHDYLIAKSTLLLVQKHHPARLPVAFAYSIYRVLLPKVVRLQWRRFTSVLRAYRDVAGELVQLRQVASARVTSTKSR